MRFRAARHLLFGACLLATGAMAEDEPQAPAVVVGSLTAVRGERLIVLDNGKVQRGAISRQQTGYMVSRPEGRLVFPFDQVLFEADDLEDAYRQHRRLIPQESTSAHIELARWCQIYGLRDQARSELRAALKLDPNSTTARNLLQRLDEQMLPSNDLPQVRVTANGFSMLGSARPLPTEEALGGLPRELAAEFVSRVQPLLVNRCATAGCHGPGTSNGFELHRVKIGKPIPRTYSEQNLKELLSLIDDDQPTRSTLFVKLRADANVSGQRLTHGGLSQTQLNVLRNWVNSVVRQRRAKLEPNALPVTNPSEKPADDPNLSRESD